MEAVTTTSDTTTATALYVVPPAGAASSDLHERETRAVLGNALAELVGASFAGELAGEIDAAVEPYFLPAETLTEAEARRLGIVSEGDLFGGVVPFRFVGTKAITHGLVSADAAAPEGWQQPLAEEIADIVLDGFTAFSRADAERAAGRLLGCSPIQLKQAAGMGGHGQATVDDAQSLGSALDGVDWDEVAKTGLVLERRLERSTTYSVGQVRVNGMVASYYGLQKETEAANHSYEGSVLLIVRGGFDELARLDLSEPVRTAVEQARRFDAAVERNYPGFFASRRNYDVIHGFDAEGGLHSGVLEQSWRVGGASGAEIMALLSFVDRPTQTQVKARTVEIFGQVAEVPSSALLLFRGVDPRVGPLTKYAVTERP